MVPQTKWTDRKFDFSYPVGVFPCILERFRGTPARLEEIVKPLSPKICTTRIADAWSIQEHAGHLYDLEELGEKRITDFLARKEKLTTADMTNRKTAEANHNAVPIQVILRKFRDARFTSVARLERLTEEEAGIISLHPRLNTPMRIVDWLYFMSEHDDHHLARITSNIITLSQ
ncbi:MAG: DinB family protein [Bacteroidota bacterium]